jgi:serine/threonine-protein kinase
MSEMPLSIGEMVENYRVVGVIGAGGMGTVYKVQHLISDRIEAMKAILPDLLGTSEAAERFIREIKVQARLSHPNIASLHNALQVNNQFFMVMEYIEGSTLHARVRQGRLDTGLGVDITLQILNALAYAHAQGVIHRDIKPANIMLTNAGVAKVMDFGIARSLTDKQLTRAGSAVGSLYYMSPEQVQGATVDGRSDLYSVGILLYEMVTGTKPITGDTSWAVMNAHIHFVPRPASEVNPLVPTVLSEILARSIQKSPYERFQSATEFSDALRSVRALMPPSAAAPARFGAADLQMTEAVPSNPNPAFPPLQQSFGAPVPGPIRSTAPPVSAATPLPSTPVPTPGSSGTIDPRRFDAAGLERVTRELATHVGPMARVLVNRAAKKAETWRQLYEILSNEVPAGDERRRFLARRPLSS